MKTLNIIKSAVVIIIWTACIVLLMWQVGESRERNFTQMDIARAYLDEDRYVRGVAFGLATATMDMHDMISRAFADQPTRCIFTGDETEMILEELSRDYLRGVYETNWRHTINMTFDLLCSEQTGFSVVEALLDRAAIESSGRY